MDQTSQGSETKLQHVVLHDHFDSQIYDETLEMYPPLQEVVETGTINEAATFVEDAFCSFYKAAPTLSPDEHLTLSAQIRRKMITEMMSTAEYQQVRVAGTMYDQFSSAIATTAVAYKIMEKLDGKTRTRLNDLQEAETEAISLFNQAQNLEQLAGHAGEDNESVQEMYQQAQELRDQAQAEQQKAEDLYSQIEATAEKLEDATRRASREGLSQAEAEIDEANNAINAYSGGGYSHEQGVPRRVENAKEKLALAKRVMGNKKLARIAELAGRMVNTALRKQRSKVLHPPDEVVGITTGDDFNIMLSVELVKLGDPMLEMLFYQQYLEKSLMQLDLRGHEKQAKGPIIACLDSSGSMDELLGTHAKSPTTKEVWSKAVVLALLAIARKQRRDFAVMFFSSFGEIKTFRFPKAQASSNELIEVAEFFWAGGTVYDDWMRESLAMSEESRFSSADVIVISDGDVGIRNNVRENYNRRRAAKQMHAYGVLLSHEARDGQRLASVTDAMVTISDLEHDDAALDMMFTI
jgi:uncharacterized protein with von Willebrand factor type A (vWA) domain